ncbi:probable carboxylesterase 2 isoform X3 [Rhodamnia argentea]|uniref:Probable carboxylesterase 2 isoform X3 n=1 Tax=Rhodamnia argentea TaxID=178133 RepID=A0ABM3H3Y3_9MYRT|nr:probable carboxylesterase 2 isoform X3 [Rhodamnia argentea]
MDSSKEVSLEIFPYIRVYKDGTFDRLAGFEIAPPGLDPETRVESKDILILPETGISARIYRPSSASAATKLPLVIYFHGGAFIIASIADPKYHASLNALVAESNVVVVSVDYRRVPEHPLPTAYEDSWAALQWIASEEAQCEPWLRDHADFDRLFLVGDSGGANMSHHLAMRLRDDVLGERVKLSGIGMIQPYFWGETPIGAEKADPGRKALVDSWWRYVCVSGKGCDDPLINPFADGAPGVDGMACEKVLVIVSDKDILRDRGRLYYEKLVESSGAAATAAEIMEIEGEDHVFHIFDPSCEKAKRLFKRVASFVNSDGDARKGA